MSGVFCARNVSKKPVEIEIRSSRSNLVTKISFRLPSLLVRRHTARVALCTRSCFNSQERCLRTLPPARCNNEINTRFKQRSRNGCIISYRRGVQLYLPHERDTIVLGNIRRHARSSKQQGLSCWHAFPSIAYVWIRPPRQEALLRYTSSGNVLSPWESSR